MAVWGGVTRPQRRVFHSDLGPGAAGGSFLGRSDVGELTRRTAVLCPVKEWRLRRGAGERVWSREESVLRLYEPDVRQVREGCN